MFFKEHLSSSVLGTMLLLLMDIYVCVDVYLKQVGITRNSAASLCRGSPRLCNEYLLFRFPNLS